MKRSKSIKNCSFFTLLFFLFAACNAHESAQTTENNNFDSTAGEVVSTLGASIFIIFQDRQNTYWFGSNDNGVYRYDGNIIKHYSTNHGLLSNQIREIQEDKFGNIYFTTLNGINRFDGENITDLPHAKTTAWKLTADDIWFTAPGKNGPYRFDGDSLYDLKFPKHSMHDQFYAKYPNVAYSPYELYSTYRDDSGNIWFGTSNFGICRYNGNSLDWLYEEHLTTIKKTGGSFGIRAMIEDKSGHFWFCNTRYRYTINATSKASNKISYKRLPGIADLSAPDNENFIYFMSATKDDQGNLWMATYDQGVWQYDGITCIHHPIGTTVYSIYNDRVGNLWLGTHEEGAYKYNGEVFEKFNP